MGAEYAARGERKHGCADDLRRERRVGGEPTDFHHDRGGLGPCAGLDIGGDGDATADELERDCPERNLEVEADLAAELQLTRATEAREGLLKKEWDGVGWDEVWDGMGWGLGWDGMGWDGMGFGMAWHGMGWDGTGSDGIGRDGDGMGMGWD